MIFLIDCNNFYASVEQIFNPSLADKPTVILSNNDGCVIARNPKAKALGIEMGAVAHLSEELFKSKDVQVFSSNYPLYHSISRRIMKIITDYCPEVELYSIDEAFANFSGCRYLNLYRIARLLRARILREIGIQVSIGIGKTKTLAKLANRYAKKERREIGVYMLDTPEKVQLILNYTDVGDVWGIGKRLAVKFHAIGVNKAIDLLSVPVDWLRRNMSVVMVRLVSELKGTSCDDLEIIAPSQQVIGTAKSFGRPLSTFPEIQEALANYVVLVATRLRKQKSLVKQLTVFITTNPFSRESAQYHRSIDLQLPVATNSTFEILKFATLALKRIYKEGYQYKKIGIFLIELSDESVIQPSLFYGKDLSRQERLMKVLDKINEEKQLVKIATQGKGEKFRMRQQRVSKRYTTKLSDVLVVY